MASVLLASAVLVDGPSATGTAGEGLAQGDVVYSDPSDSGELKKAKADAAATSMAVGIALSAPTSGSTFRYARDGAYVRTSATLTAGEVYVVDSTNAGEVDSTTAGYCTVVGIAISANILKVNFITSGVTK